ncbi:hypothetical protein [Brevundimonas sp.]|jgi:hypothetical protein|uniref:hypothetical protein n=1 Tax=unclassified Brevundimonas TaxID=2622653 RepID=UPI003566474D
MHTFVFDSNAGAETSLSWSCDLPDINVAKRQAIETFAHLLLHDGADFWSRPAVQMTVSNLEGMVLVRIDLAAMAPASSQRP